MTLFMVLGIMDWSIIMGREGYKTGGGRGGYIKLGNVLFMLKGGHKKFPDSLIVG